MNWLIMAASSSSSVANGGEFHAITSSAEEKELFRWQIYGIFSTVALAIVIIVLVILLILKNVEIKGLKNGGSK